MRRASVVGLVAVASLWGQENASELLARGEQLIPSKPAEAVRLLQQALRLNPALPALRYQLGLAYHAIGDEADAEVELREAVKSTPTAAAHNYLGIVLFQMGDAKASLEEFREAVTLAPKDPNAHFNLGEALARTGDSDRAVEELRTASTLTPEDAGLARLLNVVESKLAPNTIKVDVRQVLVPVVVTDRDGHPVSGLTEKDFRVFEDGVEQTISGFNVESSYGTGLAVAAKSETPRAAPTAAGNAPAAVRRTYLICIDTLHSSFKNFEAVRASLVKLFREERSADSQYVVVALGTSAQMVVNVTPDPAAVLAVFESKRMQKIFLDGQQGGLNAEMERFRRDLVQTRQACDLVAQDKLFQGKCESGMLGANLMATEIAELERTLTAGFLRGFGGLISQLARARDRRTVVFISDGFGIEPGHEAYSLVNAYFPVASHCLVPPPVDCQPTGRMTASRMQEEFEPILRMAAQSNVTIDTIDSRGLFGQAAFDAANPGNPLSVDGAVGRVERGEAASAGNTLAEIADATGGTAFHDNNNLLGGLQRAFADAREYYTIAYVSGNESLDGKFRSIAVQVRDRAATVKAKRGYWAAK